MRFGRAVAAVLPWATGSYSNVLGLWFSSNRTLSSCFRTEMRMDPLGFGGYDYAGGNPVSFYDPSGLSAQSDRFFDPTYISSSGEYAAHGGGGYRGPGIWASDLSYGPETPLGVRHVGGSQTGLGSFGFSSATTTGTDLGTSFNGGDQVSASGGDLSASSGATPGVPTEPGGGDPGVTPTAAWQPVELSSPEALKALDETGFRPEKLPGHFTDHPTVAIGSETVTFASEQGHEAAARDLLKQGFKGEAHLAEGKW